MLPPWKKSYDQPRQHIKKQRHYFVDKGLSSQSYGFSSSHVWMWELDYKASWPLKNWCFWTVVLEKTLESSLNCKGIKPVSPKGNQSWTFIGRTDAEAERSNTLANWCEDLTHWKKPWCWERLKVGGGDQIRWDGWMASPIQWTWVWAGSRNWWWTGKPGVLQSMASQKVGHGWVSELETGWRKRKITTHKGKDYPETPILRWNKCWNYLTKTFFFYISLVFFHKIASNKIIKYLVCTCIHGCTSDIFSTNSLMFLKKSKNMSGSFLAFCWFT